MRFLVTRSPEDAARTAEKLAARGHEACLAPVTRIVPTGDPMPSEPYDALIVTSAHAEAALAALDRTKPVFAVGERTAEPLRAAGFPDITVAEGDAVSLVRLIRGTLAPGPTLLHVTARHHKEEPAASLRASGFTILQWEAYEAKAIERLPDSAVEALRSGQIDAALHYSRRSADIVIGLAGEAGLAQSLLAVPHLCLSDDVAVPLRSAGAAALAAEEPSEEALLRLLDRVP